MESKQRAFPWPKFGTMMGEEEIQAAGEVIRECAATGKPMTRGDRLTAFEEAFAEYVGAEYAIATNSCATALLTTVRALDIGPGDEVITTPNTHLSTATGVLEVGAQPVFVDIDPETLNLDPSKIEAKITSKTRAIYPVHYAGLPADLDPIHDIARKHSLRVVEDAAHAPGAEYRGKRIGGLSDLTCFSFQTQKNMSTLGEGGMITTNNSDLAEQCRKIRSFGTQRYADQPNPWTPWHYDVVMLGTNFRMTEPAAAVGLVQLRRLDELTRRRRAVAARYTQALSGCTGVRTPCEPEGYRHTYHIYNLLLDETEAGAARIDVLEEMKTAYRVDSVIHYKPVYLFDLFQERGYREGECPVAERLFRQIVGLPLHPSYTEEDCAYITEAVKGALASCRER